MTKGLITLRWLLPLIFIFATTAQASNKKVLLVGIDGMQFEHIAKLPTPAFDRLQITKAYAGGVKGRFSEQKTSSGPGWTTILTGVWVNKHGISSNSVGPADADWPSIFRQIHNAKDQAQMYSFSTWGTINTLYFPADMPLLAAHSEGGGDDYSVNRTLEVLGSQSPDFIFVHLDEPDGAGHSYGWGDEYDKSITGSDARLGKLLDAVEKRQTEKDEEWLVLVTTDHGRNARTGSGHGNQTSSEKTIFIASNQPLHSRYQSYVSVANQDFDGLYNLPAQTFIVPTILEFLGIKQNRLRLDGFPLVGDIEAQKVYATIESKRCGLEWDADKGSPIALASYEHVAKFDCNGSADPVQIEDGYIYANIYGSSCGLQWHAAKGTPSPMGSNEHIAKFDCSNDGDPLSISSSYIYSLIESNQCGFEWNAKSGVPMTLEGYEHVAKFDCDGNADPLSFEAMR
ncbi:alkaline phosphatase family protein [Vibrio coralliilyticus]